MIACQAQTHWMPEPSKLACVEAVALIIGGRLRSGSTGVDRLEVYGSDIYMTLPGFGSGSLGQALFYHEGMVIMCGGCSDTTAVFCLKGKFMKDRRGPLRIS